MVGGLPSIDRFEHRPTIGRYYHVERQRPISTSIDADSENAFETYGQGVV